MSSAALEHTTEYERAYRAATDAIQAFDVACDALIEARDRLVALQTQRPEQKIGAVVRLCLQPHPANTAKTFSITQAEDMAQIDPEYAAHKALVAVAESEVRQAKAAKRSAWLVAKLAIARMKRAGGLT